MLEETSGSSPPIVCRSAIIPKLTTKRGLQTEKWGSGAVYSLLWSWCQCRERLGSHPDLAETSELQGSPRQQRSSLHPAWCSAVRCREGTEHPAGMWHPPGAPGAFQGGHGTVRWQEALGECKNPSSNQEGAFLPKRLSGLENQCRRCDTYTAGWGAAHVGWWQPACSRLFLTCCGLQI